MSISRGLRNNNPGNLRDLGINWLGLDSPRSDADGYLRFTTAAFGLRALARDLRTKWTRDKLRTVADIIGKYAPTGDNNNVTAYVAFVTKQLGVRAVQLIDLTNDATLLALVSAIVSFENGQQPYTREVILAAIASAKDAPIG